MDKVFSARIDESTLALIEVLSRRTGKSKKKILEEAIRDYESKVGEEDRVDILEHTFGAWKRPEAAKETVEKVRSAFSRSFERHRR